MIIDEYKQKVITRAYKAAVDKNTEIKKLSEGMGIPEQDLIDFIASQGLVSGIKKPKPVSANFVWTPELDREIMHRKENGESNITIAEALGLDNNKVGRRIYYIKQKMKSFDVEESQPIKPIKPEEQTNNKPTTCNKTNVIEIMQKLLKTAADMQGSIKAFSADEESNSAWVKFISNGITYNLSFSKIDIEVE